MIRALFRPVLPALLLTASLATARSWVDLRLPFEATLKLDGDDAVPALQYAIEPAVGIRVTENFQIGFAYHRSARQEDGWLSSVQPGDTLLVPRNMLYKVDSRASGVEFYLQYDLRVWTFLGKVFPFIGISAGGRNVESDLRIYDERSGGYVKYEQPPSSAVLQSGRYGGYSGLAYQADERVTLFFLLQGALHTSNLIGLYRDAHEAADMRLGFAVAL